MVLKFARDDGEEMAASDLTTRYLYGPAVDQVLAEERLSPLPPEQGGGYDLTNPGNVLWMFADHQGTIRDVADYDSGDTNLVDHLRYGSFGDFLGQTDDDYAPTLSYTGRQYDTETGLNCDRARWYDAVSGRFLGEDPQGFAAGDANLARYCGNSPATYTDAFGTVRDPRDPRCSAPPNSHRRQVPPQRPVSPFLGDDQPAPPSSAVNSGLSGLGGDVSGSRTHDSGGGTHNVGARLEPVSFGDWAMHEHVITDQPGEIEPPPKFDNLPPMPISGPIGPPGSLFIDPILPAKPKTVVKIVPSHGLWHNYDQAVANGNGPNWLTRTVVFLIWRPLLPATEGSYTVYYSDGTWAAFIGEPSSGALLAQAGVITGVGPTYKAGKLGILKLRSLLIPKPSNLRTPAQEAAKEFFNPFRGKKMGGKFESPVPPAHEGPSWWPPRGINGDGGGFTRPLDGPGGDPSWWPPPGHGG